MSAYKFDVHELLYSNLIIILYITYMVNEINNN